MSVMCPAHPPPGFGQTGPSRPSSRSLVPLRCPGCSWPFLNGDRRAEPSKHFGNCIQLAKYVFEKETDELDMKDFETPQAAFIFFV